MHDSLNNGAAKLVKGMLEVDPRKRLQAHHLIRDPYVVCDEVRMTAFEMAGSVSRQAGQRNFKREIIKVAHNRAVETLVSPRNFHSQFIRKLKTTRNPISSFASKKVYKVKQVHRKRIRSTVFTNEQLCKIYYIHKKHSIIKAS